MHAPESLAIIASGVFFLVGLLTGTWKYLQIHTSENGEAHPYVDICHRASLLYAFAALLLSRFAEISQLPELVELIAMALVLFYFATAITTYFIHGLLRDTENQLKPPFTLGKREVSAGFISIQMWMLIVAETGGFLVLFYGVLVELL